MISLSGSRHAMRFARRMHVSVDKLERSYETAKLGISACLHEGQMNPRAVFANNELNLRDIQVYGFDYDYTLAVYTRELNELIYNLALERLIKKMKYPEALLSIEYDKEFAIRGLHFDIQNSCLLKVDAFSQVQRGTVHRGRRKLDDIQTRKLYPAFGLPDVKGRDFPQLIDLFSLPWAGLLATVIHHCDTHNIQFHPKSLYDDIAECVRQVHISGDMYERIEDNMSKYVHPNEGLKEYLQMLYADGKELFVVTNSPFKFINIGMSYMLGKYWRKYFKYIVVSARKPTFFYRNEPFRLYDVHSDVVRFEKVDDLQSGCVYAGGNIEGLSAGAGYADKGVLYCGDHIYTDLADPMLRLGWRTAAVVPELAREIRIQNSTEYRDIIMWLETLTNLIQTFQADAERSKDTARVIKRWKDERAQIREDVKSMSNPRFGSIFRTYTNMTYFSRRLNRLSDVYTSRVPNMLAYSTDHEFFPRRNALPHEDLQLVPLVSHGIINQLNTQNRTIFPKVTVNK